VADAAFGQLKLTTRFALVLVDGWRVSLRYDLHMIVCRLSTVSTALNDRMSPTAHKHRVVIASPDSLRGFADRRE